MTAMILSIECSTFAVSCYYCVDGMTLTVNLQAMSLMSIYQNLINNKLDKLPATHCTFVTDSMQRCLKDLNMISTESKLSPKVTNVRDDLLFCCTIVEHTVRSWVKSGGHACSGFQSDSFLRLLLCTLDCPDLFISYSALRLLTNLLFYSPPKEMLDVLWEDIFSVFDSGEFSETGLLHRIDLLCNLFSSKISLDIDAQNDLVRRFAAHANNLVEFVFDKKRICKCAKTNNNMSKNVNKIMIRNNCLGPNIIYSFCKLLVKITKHAKRFNAKFASDNATQCNTKSVLNNATNSCINSVSDKATHSSFRSSSTKAAQASSDSVLENSTHSISAVLTSDASLHATDDSWSEILASVSQKLLYKLASGLVPDSCARRVLDVLLWSLRDCPAVRMSCTRVVSTAHLRLAEDYVMATFEADMQFCGRNVKKSAHGYKQANTNNILTCKDNKDLHIIYSDKPARNDELHNDDKSTQCDDKLGHNDKPAHNDDKSAHGDIPARCDDKSAHNDIDPNIDKRPQDHKPVRHGKQSNDDTLAYNSRPDPSHEVSLAQIVAIIPVRRWLHTCLVRLGSSTGFGGFSWNARQQKSHASMSREKVQIQHGTEWCAAFDKCSAGTNTCEHLRLDNSCNKHTKCNHLHSSTIEHYLRHNDESDIKSNEQKFHQDDWIQFEPFINHSEVDRKSLRKFVSVTLKSLAVISGFIFGCIKEGHCTVKASSDSDNIERNNSLADGILKEDVIRKPASSMNSQMILAMLCSLQWFVREAIDCEIWSWLAELFFEQDDSYVEALLCLLDINIYLEESGPAHHASHHGILRVYDSHLYFLQWLDVVAGWDPSFCLDLLMSPETSFLLYLSRQLRHVTQTWDRWFVACRDYKSRDASCAVSTATALLPAGQSLNDDMFTSKSPNNEFPITEVPITEVPLAKSLIDELLIDGNLPTDDNRNSRRVGVNESRILQVNHLPVRLTDYSDSDNSLDSSSESTENEGRVYAVARNSSELPLNCKNQKCAMETAHVINDVIFCPNTNVAINSKDVNKDDKEYIVRKKIKLDQFANNNDTRYVALCTMDSFSISSAESGVTVSDAISLDDVSDAIHMSVNNVSDAVHVDNVLDRAMTCLIRLRIAIEKLDSMRLFPYRIQPLLQLIESCERLYEEAG